MRAARVSRSTHPLSISSCFTPDGGGRPGGSWRARPSAGRSTSGRASREEVLHECRELFGRQPERSGADVFQNPVGQFTGKRGISFSRGFTDFAWPARRPGTGRQRFRNAVKRDEIATFECRGLGNVTRPMSRARRGWRAGWVEFKPRLEGDQRWVLIGRHCSLLVPNHLDWLIVVELAVTEELHGVPTG
jgi:hypothetical protein